MSDEYKKCLNTFLNHAFATSALGSEIACPYALCCSYFYSDRDTVRGHLFMKVMDVDYQQGTWNLHRKQSITNYDSDDDMVHYECTCANHESFEYEIYAVINVAFEQHEPTIVRLAQTTKQDIS